MITKEEFLHQTLLELPLFQGLSNSDLLDIIAHVDMDVMKVKPAKTFIREGSAYTHLMFLLKGEVCAETKADDGRYIVKEHYSSPNILQPEHIFGLNQYFSSTFSTLTPCEFIRIQKGMTYQLAADYEVFRLNLLNMLSTQNQRLVRKPWRILPHSIRQKIVRFFENHCVRPAGRKTFTITMNQLATEIGESRLNLSRELHRMEAESLISVHRGKIVIPALEKLLM
ncbi:MAG: Crp/Fnr family transcriptional regulator [Prevotella sp.]|nr:Crp/Fnr family transcriptional regulator [Prevotella sp.]